MSTLVYSSLHAEVACIQGITAVIFFSVIQELIHRDGLRAALSGRDDVLLEPIIRMLSQYVSDVRWGELACEVAAVILGKFCACGADLL